MNLREINKMDLSLIQAYRNSSNVMPYCREYRYLTDMDQEHWLDNYHKQRRTSDWDVELMIIGEDKSDMFYGVCGFTRIQWRNRKAELSFYIGHSECNYPYFIEKALNLILERGFNVWNFHKIYWPVYGHDPNLPIYKKIMEEEAVLKKEYYWDGKYYDRHYLVKYKE